VSQKLRAVQVHLNLEPESGEGVGVMVEVATSYGIDGNASTAGLVLKRSNCASLSILTFTMLRSGSRGSSRPRHSRWLLP
jgi:hypothetical protein